MFVREKHYDNAIQKVRVDLGKELGLDSATDAHVTFREPSEREVLKLKAAQDEIERLDVFRQIFVDSLIEHDFYEIEGVKMEAEKVIDLLYEKMDTTDKLVTEYSNAVFLSRMREAEGK